jgi:hypothetical protein
LEQLFVRNVADVISKVEKEQAEDLLKYLKIFTDPNGILGW